MSASTPFSLPGPHGGVLHGLIDLPAQRGEFVIELHDAGLELVFVG